MILRGVPNFRNFEIPKILAPLRQAQDIAWPKATRAGKKQGFNFKVPKRLFENSVACHAERRF
jgi:hypothetical protein